MRTIELTGRVDVGSRLSAEVPGSLPLGPVRLLVLVDPPAQGEDQWMTAVAEQWADDLADVRQDIYTLEDGQPVVSQ